MYNISSLKKLAVVLPFAKKNWFLTAFGFKQSHMKADSICETANH